MKKILFFTVALASAALIALFASHIFVRAAGGPAEADLWASGSNAASFTVGEDTGNGVNFEWCGAGTPGAGQHQCANADDCALWEGQPTYSGDFPHGTFVWSPGERALITNAMFSDFWVSTPKKGPYTLACGSNGVGVTFDIINVNTRPVARAVADVLNDGNPNGQVLPAASVTVYRGYSVSIDGRTSSDQDNDTLTYSWSCTGGALSSAISNRPSWNHDGQVAVGNYTCDLTVNDGSVSSNNAARVSIAVVPTTTTPGACSATHFGCTSPTPSINNAGSAAAGYTWQCPGSGFPLGSTASCTEAPPGAPEASITTPRASITAGDSTVVNWCGTDNHGCANAVSCRVGTSPGGSNVANDTIGNCRGPISTGTLNTAGSYPYYLTTTNSAGVTNSASVTVTVSAPAATAPTTAPGISVAQVCSPQGMQIFIDSRATGASSYDFDRCTDATCSSATTVGQSIAQTTYIDTGATTNSTTYYYRARGRNSVGAGPNSSVMSGTFSIGACTVDASAFLSIRTNTGAVVVTGSNASPRPSGFTKANTPINFFMGGSGATQCSLINAEKTKGVQVRAGQSIQCSGAACASGVTLPYNVSALMPQPSTENPIDEIDATNVCENSAHEAAFVFANLFLTPGDFSLDAPTNSCPAGTSAPVTLVWSASPAAEKYNVFRVIDEDRNGAVTENEIQEAIDAGTYNLNFASPLSPRDAQCDTDTSCTWKDESAKKNVPYFYIVRSRNEKGVTFSDTLIANKLEDYKPKSITPGCAPTATLRAPSPINFGQSAALTWGSTNADSCSIDQGVGGVCGVGLVSCDTGGTKIVPQSRDTTYTLTCTGATPPAASAAATVNINNRAPVAVAGVGKDDVQGVPNPVTRVYSDTLRVKQNAPVTLYFAPFNGGTLSGHPLSSESSDPDGNGHETKGILNGGTCEWNSGLASAINPITGQFDFDSHIDQTKTIGSVFPQDCMVAATHSFADLGGTYHVFRLKDKFSPTPGQSTVADVTITAVPAPLITSFTATPNPINQDQAFTLAWASTGTASCSSPDTDFNTAIAGRKSGSAPISNLRVSPKDYVLNCTSADIDLYPTAATQTVTVTINGPSCNTPPFSASPSTTPAPGALSTLAWTAANARQCRIDDNDGIAANNIGVVCGTGTQPLVPCVSGTVDVRPLTVTQYTFSCTGDGSPACSVPATVAIQNQVPTARVGASTNISVPRTYSNTITVTQNVPTDIFLSAGPTIDGAAGSSDSDGSLARCDWNTDFGRAPPITFEQNNTISPPGEIADCDRTVSGKIFTESPTAVGTPNIYPLLRVTDNQGATADADLRVNILPQLAVSLVANPVSDNAPFSPTLRADITTYTGAAGDTGNFYFWFDCINTNPDLGVVKAACGDPTAITDTGGDRACTLSGDKKMAKCETVPLQGFDFLSLMAPGYAARATAYSPKVIVERGTARSAEARASATANTPFAYTLAKTGGDIDVVKGASGNTTITFDHTGGAAQSVSFSASGSSAPGSFSDFFGFPARFFSESIITRDKILKATDAQYLSLRDMHNGNAPYAFERIEYNPAVFGATTPQGIQLGDAAFPGLNAGNPRWEVMAHENGHNFFGGTSAFYGTLAFGHPFLQESLAVLSAFYTYHTTLDNPSRFGVDQATIGSLSYDFVNGRRYQNEQYNLYVSRNAPFDIDDVLTSQALDYQMIAYGEQYGWQNYRKFTRAFENGITPQFTFQQNGVSATEQSTYVVAALGAAFGRDFRADFQRLNFPVDAVLYNEVRGKIESYMVANPPSPLTVSSSLSGLPAGVTDSFSPSNCTSDCATTMTISAAASTPPGGPTTIIVSGSVPGGTNASVNLTVRDTLSCAPTTQTAVVGVPTSPITAAGGTGTNLWEVFHPSNLLTRDPNASPNTGSGATFSTTFGTTGNGRIIRVTSGSQTKECTADVVGQTLSAAISAVPNSGVAPLASTITGQITSGSTAVGTINYLFWWDCANDGANVTNVINGTGLGANGGIACSNPEGSTANLATNYPSITCKGNAVGAKCFVDPAAVPAAEAFNPVTKPLQVAHTYAGRIAPYIPKVIIERGSAPADEARASVTASFPPLSVSCSVPETATAGTAVSWTATPSGGSSPYTYTWAGTDDLQGKTGTPVSITYFTAGAKTGTVTVRDTATGQTAASSQCSTTVSLPAGGAPVAIAGISKDTASVKTFRSAVDVKKGESVELHFAAERTNSAGTLERSTDPDGWNDQFNGIARCQINTDLSTEAVIQNQFIGSGNADLANPPANSPDLCRASGTHTFNNDPEDPDGTGPLTADHQISRSIAFNTLRLIDKQNAEAVGQANVIIHYAPTASLTVNGGATATVNAGAPVVLTWSSKHASSCTGTGFSTGATSPASGTITVNPAADTTYSVSCSGSALWGAAAASVGVTINAPTADLKANGSDGPITVAAGANVDLTWTSANATSCTGTNFSTGTGNPPQSTGTGIRVNPATATTYSISCARTGAAAATDNVVVSIPFTFTLAKEKDISVLQGATTNNTSIVTATKTGGTGEVITFSASGLPTGASASFSPTSCTPGASPCTTTLTIATTKGIGATPAGVHSLTITGAAQGGATANAPLTLTVSSRMDVELSDPTSAIVGTPITLTATVSNYTGDPTDTINYKFWKNCTNAESQNLPVVITACGNPDASFDGVTANPQSATLTYTTTGSFIPKVFVQRGAAANEDRADSPVVVAPPFTFTLANSGNISVTQGATAGNANTITVTKTAGTGQAVTLSASGLPQGATASFSPTSCTPGASPCTTTLTIATTKGIGATPVGTHPITVTGAAGAVTAVAPPFNLIVSSQMSVDLSALPSATGPAPYVLQLQAAAPAVDYTGEPTDTVTYTFWKNCNTAGTNVAALSAATACGAPDYVAANVTALTARTTDLIYTTQGTFHAKVVASRGAASAEDSITITVNPPFNYALSLDRSRVELVQGTNSASANRVTATHGSGAPTALTFGALVQNLPASAPNPVISFSPSSCAPPSGASCAADISISTVPELPAGDYPVVISAGSKNITFTLGITSRIDAALAAVPLAAGPAPHLAQLRATASSYTGASIDALNYSFWWNCNNPTDSPSAAQDACGDPMDAAVGFKMNGTMQEIFTTPSVHAYPTEGIYFAKVIVERGGARREARLAITVGNPKVSVSCSVAPAVAVVNQPVTWTAAPALGTAPYGYAWTQNVSCGLNPTQCASVPMQYASAGDKFGSVTITDAKGDTATRLCDNALKVFQPTLVIVPATAQIRADGDTMQFVAKYDPDGPGGSQPEQTVTGNATWSIPLGEQQRATVSGGGLVTTKSITGSVTLTASFKDAFNNVIAATAAISVIPRENLVCDPAKQTVRTGETTFPMKASGGTGSYDWLVQETDATPRAGSTVGSQTFTTVFSQAGTKTVGVTSGSQSGSCEVTVIGQSISVNLSAFPASVTVPDSTRLTAVVSGNALGTINYSYWWDCGQDKDADNTTRVEIAEGRCGVLPTGVAAGQCAENQFGAKCNVIATVSRAIDHIYQETGDKSPKVIVERGNAAPAQYKASVAVDAANAAPDAIAGISADVNATRVYARSIVVTQNVPTQIYFAAFTGKTNAVDEKSTDPNGWINALNGVYHPTAPAASGQCAWNADLDRNAQVSFEDVSGTNRNPASEKECVTSFVHNFQDLGTHTYAVLRITDNRGAASNPALVTVDVTAPGAPVAIPGVSADPSAERIYKEVVKVKQGENTELWVSAKRRVGATDMISSDPDGWRSKNGGVSRGGSCRWNRDLDKGVFPTGVPTYEYLITDPLDPAEDCDTKIVNEAGNSFIRVFNDAPRDEPYAFEALRIFDNTGLRSNKGMIKVQVLPSDPPIAVASASTDNGVTFHGVTAGDPLVVVRGQPAPIIFSAAGSTDPDGWTNPVNGVAVSGHCDWNSDLDQSGATFEQRISTPASPTACNLAPRTYTFNDRPGIIDFDLLKITDNKGFTSLSAGGISVRVTAPDLVVSEGPVPASAAALVENGSAAFRGKVKNQGDAGTSAAFGTVFRLDLGNNGSTDATLASTPATVAGLAVGAEREITSASFTGLPAGTHKITLCADQPAPAVTNEFFTDNNCASQVITVLPDNRPPSAEAGISVDGVTYGSSITVLRGTPLQIWLSADKDVDGNTVASFDPDGWSDSQKGVASGGKCDWNIDLRSAFAAQNTVNNPASPTICNRNRMDKTFNDPPGTYIYPVLRITDAKGAASSVAAVSVRVVSSTAQLTHMACVAQACTVTSGAGANVCSVAGAACIGAGGPSASPRPDLLVSRAPRLLNGRLERGRTITFDGKVRNRSGVDILSPFKNAFLIDLNNNGTIEVSLQALPRAVSRLLRAQFAALPISDLALPLPATVASLGIDEETAVLSGEWRAIPEGTHRIILCADSDNEITEFDEDNNCDSSLVQVTAPSISGGPLRVDSCGVSDSEVRAGQLVDWSAHATGGTGAYSFSWSGDVPLEGAVANPVSVAYRTTGTKSGSVIATSGSETASRSCGTVNVLAGIIEFTANPRQINAGETSTLSWNTTGFTSCAITADQTGQSIGSVPTTGTRIIQPPRNTVYTLTCDTQGDSQSVTVVVSSIPRFQEVTP